MRIVVRGRSMLPTLADGDEVEVRLCAGDEARVGDVVLVLQTGAPPVTVLHRVIARGPDSLLTQGDGVRWPDDPVPFDRVLGVAAVPRRPVYALARRVRAGLAGFKRRVLQSKDA